MCRVVRIRVDRHRQLVLQLNSVAPPVVHIDVGRLVVRVPGIVISVPAKIDLPMLIPRRTWIVGDKRRSALGAYQGCRQSERDEETESDKSSGFAHSEELSMNQPGLSPCDDFRQI